MQDDRTFRQLLDGLRAGSDESVRELIDRYGQHIHRIVRRRLNQALRARFDSQDFVQAVWASFFAHSSRIADFDTPDEMIAFLATVAGNKVSDECRRNLKAQKRNVNRERSLHGTTDSCRIEPTDRSPTPSEVAIAAEQFEQLTSGQPSHYRRMVELRAEGATYEEVAQELGVSERNVRRIFRRLEQRVN